MSNNKNKRIRLIKKHLNEIAKLPFYDSKNGKPISLKNYFICPLCLKTFNIDALGDKISDSLTLEDVPPKSLGGSPIVITCRDCNSSCGYKLDTFLLNEFRNEEERHDFNKTKRALLTFNNIGVNATIKADDNVVDFDIRTGLNNPIKVKDFIYQLSNAGPKWSVRAEIKLIDFKRKPEVIEVAALKSAYLLAFRQLGYKYILNTNLNCIREQILNPGENILGHSYVVGNESMLPKGFPDGVFLATLNEIQCVVVVFTLKYKTIVHRVAIALPSPEDKDCKVYNKDLLDHNKSITILGPAAMN